MRALAKTQAAPGLELIEVPEPTIGINDVLIKVLRTGICGTDLHIESWDHWAQTHIKPPLVIGHEFVGEVVEFELAASFDLEGVALPRRQIVQNVCPWTYRGAECGYTGLSYFNGNDAAVTSAAQDACGKRLSSCKKRFGANAELPFGGFPAAGLIR